MKRRRQPTRIELIEAEFDREYPELLAERERDRAEKLRARDYEGYLLKCGGCQRLPALLKIELLVPDKEYWRCLNLAWSNIEISAPDQREWLRLFTSQRSHREFLMSVRARRTLAAMAQTLTIYRGYARGRARSGLSWTLSKKQAQFFAEYAIGRRRELFCGHSRSAAPMIAIGRCFKSDVLAYFNGRREREIVINPRKVFAKRSVSIKPR